MMQIGFVHHDDARMAQRGLVGEPVVAVVSHVIQCDVKSLGIEGLLAAGKDLQVHEWFQGLQQGFGIVGDPAARRRQRGEKSQAHFSAPVPGKWCLR